MILMNEINMKKWTSHVIFDTCGIFLVTWKERMLKSNKLSTSPNQSL